MTRIDDFDASIYIRAMSNIFFPSIMCVGVVGNAMVIVVIFSTKKMRNSTNIFLANLAVADLINLLVCGTLSFIDMFSPGLLDSGQGVCKIVPMIAEALTYASVLTVFAVGYERYFAICQPLKAGYVCTESRAWKVCLLAWPIAILFSSPYLLIMDYQQLIGSNQGSCQVRHDTLWIKAFVVVTASKFFILPAIILTVLHVLIIQHLKKAALAPSVNISAIKDRRQVVAMLATVVLCFFLFLLPFRAYTVFLISTPADTGMWLGSQGYYDWLLFARAMIYVHSAVNPILYSLMSKRFRNGFKSICSGGRLRKSKKVGTESTNTISTEMSASCD